VEHITLSEDLVKQWIQGSLDGPATPQRKSEEKYTAETLIAIVTDRSQNRSKTGGPWLPDGQFPTTADAIRAFEFPQAITWKGGNIENRVYLPYANDHIGPSPAF
jgi:hypothetical protein